MQFTATYNSKMEIPGGERSSDRSGGASLLPSGPGHRSGPVSCFEFPRESAPQGRTASLFDAPVAPPPPPQSPAVDLLSLLKRCLGNIKLVERVLAKFHETGSVDLERLEQAWERSDLQVVVEVAHRLKGAASNVSAPVLHELAALAEQLGRDLNRGALEEVLVQLRAEWARFVRYSEAFAPRAAAGSLGTGKSES